MSTENRKRTRKPQRKTAGFHWIFIAAVIFCQFLGYTWVRTESTQTILDISAKTSQLTRIQAYQKALAVERDHLKTDERITRIAKKQLNLYADTLSRTIYLPLQGINQ